MKVYIDFDDVICETARTFIILARDLFNIDLPYQEFQFFNMQQSFGLNEEQYKILMAAGHTKEALLSYEETENACKTINKWVDKGHEVSIITGRPGEAYESSRQWLDEHGLKRLPLFCVDKYSREGFFQMASYTMSLEELYSIPFDFAIEDSPASIKHVLHFNNCHIAIFNRPWNEKTALPNEMFERCNDWLEIDEFFNRVEEIKG